MKKGKIKVKCCPFCGKMPVVLPSGPMAWRVWKNSWGMVLCANIRCHAHPVVRCDARPSFYRESDKCRKKAIRRWNKRYEG